jgi:arylamine N-acetyltransferase
MPELKPLSTNYCAIVDNSLQTARWRLTTDDCFLYNANMNVLRDFMKHFGISPTGSPRSLLSGIVSAFAGLPYENITKIIKQAESGTPRKARRYPEEVIRNHIDWGAGGTCFSLTCALLHLVRALGWRAEYILADRRYGQNTHCALLIWIDGIPHLLDPGFLIIDPVPLPAEDELEFRTAFNRIVLARDGNQDRISLSTVGQGAKTYRLTYKTSPADTGEFLNAWDASFSWDMMRYPLLTRTADSKQIYLKGSKIQIRDGDSVQRGEILMEELIAKIAAEFRIHPSVVAHGISILRGRGEIDGKTSSR